MPQGLAACRPRYMLHFDSLCLRFWSEFRGIIPPREPLICFRRKRKKEQDTPKRRERAKQGAPPRHTTPHSSRCCTAVSLPFLPVPVPVLCGRLLHNRRTRRASYFGSSSPRRRRRGPWGVMELPEIQQPPENEARHPAATRPIVDNSDLKSSVSGLF